MLDRRDFLRLSALTGAGLALGGLEGKISSAKAATETRTVEAHLSPSAFGIGGETIDLSQFQMEYFSTADPNLFAYEMSNAVNPNGYLTLRGTFTVNDGENKVLDGLGAIANELINGENLGNPGFNAEIPGTPTGITNTVELHSALGASNPWFNFVNTGKKHFHSI
jgi:hypothetical protein